MWRILVNVVLLASAVAASATGALSQTREPRSRGVMQLAGRQVHCDQVRLRLDRHLENLGAAAVDERLLLLNPRLLGRESRIVQLFVFHHECGHHRVGASELKADCWAVDRGVRDGWLDRNGLGQVCRSFNDAPETDTHPSGRRRCANIDRCFATTEIALAREKTAQQSRIAARATEQPPKLISGPRLVRVSVLRGYAAPISSPRTTRDQ